MSTKHVRTAADLVRFGTGLKVDCASCGNSRTMDGYAVARDVRGEGVRKGAAPAQVLAVRREGGEASRPPGPDAVNAAGLTRRRSHTLDPKTQSTRSP